MTLRVPLSDCLRAPLPSDSAAPIAQNAHASVSPAAYLRSLAKRVNSQSLDELEALAAADSLPRTDLEGDEAHQKQRARRILERAWAAQQIGRLGDLSPRTVKVLEELVAHRSLHRDLAYHGLDGAAAVRALGVLRANESVLFLARTFLAIDPELKKMVEPPGSYPYSHADYRMKREIICVMGELPCKPGSTFLREYLAMDESTAGRFAGPFFEEATRALLRCTLTDGELESLLQSPNSAVRGTAMLVCLDDPTANRTAALGRFMPWAQELPRAGK